MAAVCLTAWQRCTIVECFSCCYLLFIVCCTVQRAPDSQYRDITSNTCRSTCYLVPKKCIWQAIYSMYPSRYLFYIYLCMFQGALRLPQLPPRLPQPGVRAGGGGGGGGEGGPGGGGQQGGLPLPRQQGLPPPRLQVRTTSRYYQ